MAIRYSDGDRVEARILQIVSSAQSLCSSAFSTLDPREEWAVKYHLSPDRANLVRHLDFRNLDVLELGAGMGAVSRFLAENARALTVVEGTEPRFAVLSSRLRDLSNWSGIIANIQDVNLQSRFDVVCLIGVLEYSGLYVRSSDGSVDGPFQAVLSKAKSLLKEDGVLVLAIENQLGLKYWSGAAEDHSGRVFDGICGYPPGKTPRTFSRSELLKLLRNGGFSHIDEQFPFPDYKIPSTVLTSQMIEKFPVLAAELSVSQPFESYGSRRMRYFPDTLSARSVAAAGLLAEFSNSFLFLASQTPHSQTRAQLIQRQLQGELAWHYSKERKYPTVTTFALPASGDLETRKSLINGRPEKLPAFRGVCNEFIWAPKEREAIARGISLSHLLGQSAYYKKWDWFLETLHSYLAWSFERWSTDEQNMLSGQALDAVFLNATQADKTSFELFDLEWCLKGSLTKSWFVFRNVFGLGRQFDLFTGQCPFRSLQALYEILCERLFVRPDFQADLIKEAEFQSLVTNCNIEDRHRDQLAELFSRPFALQIKPLELQTRQSAEGLKAKIRRALSNYPKIFRTAKQLFQWAKRSKQLLRYRLQNVTVESISVVGNLRKSYRLIFSKGPLPIGFVRLIVKGQIPSGPMIVHAQAAGFGDSALNMKLSIDGKGDARRKRFLIQCSCPVISMNLSFADPSARIDRVQVRTVSRIGLARRRFSVPTLDPYQAWIQSYDTITVSDREAIQTRIAQLPLKPRFSILMPVQNVALEVLEVMLESVFAQLYPDWELCLVGGSSLRAKTKAHLRKIQGTDSRLKVNWDPDVSSNVDLVKFALLTARSDWCVVVSSQGKLSEHALYMLAEELNAHPQAEVIYGDEDCLNVAGQRSSPSFKPDFSPEFFRSCDLLGSLWSCRTEHLRLICRESKDSNLASRISERAPRERVRHIPHVLYHSRAVTELSTPQIYRREKVGRPQSPTVQAIICTKDRARLLEQAVNGVLKRTKYPDIQLWIVDHASREKSTLSYLSRLSEDPRVRIIKYDGDFNFAAMNNEAARQSKSDLVLFLNNDVQVRDPHWLTEMIRLLQAPDVGAVGAKLLYPDGTIQHAGIVLGIGGVADHINRLLPGKKPGYLSRARVTGEFSAVTAACMLIKRSVFEEVGGFDEVNLPVAYNDVDLCLRIREKGYRILWSAHSALNHVESASRGSELLSVNQARFQREYRYMKSKWSNQLANDPYYSPNLSLDDVNSSLAFPPRAMRPWDMPN